MALEKFKFMTQLFRRLIMISVRYITENNIGSYYFILCMVQIPLSNLWTTRLFFNNVHISSAHHFLALTPAQFLPCSQGMNHRRIREGDRMWAHKKHFTAATVHAWFHHDQPNESWRRSNWPDVCTLVTLNKIVLGLRARR